MTFSHRASRISAEATHAMADAQSYLFDNPRHIGMAEINLKSAEADLEAAIRMVRNLRKMVEDGRQFINQEAAE